MTTNKLNNKKQKVDKDNEENQKDTLISSLREQILLKQKEIDSLNSSKHQQFIFTYLYVDAIRILNHFINKLNNPQRPNRYQKSEDIKIAHVSNTNIENLNKKNQVHLWMCRCEVIKLMKNDNWADHNKSLTDMFILWTNPTHFISHLKSYSCPCFSKWKKDKAQYKKLELFLTSNKTKLSLYFIPVHFPSKYHIYYNQSTNYYNYQNNNYESVCPELQNIYDYKFYDWFQYMHDQLPGVTYIEEEDQNTLTAYKPQNFYCHNMLNIFVQLK